jgi:hypothetical protein
LRRILLVSDGEARADEVEPADRTRPHERQRFVRLGLGEIRIPLDECHTVPARGLEHRTGFGAGGRERLFAQDVLAGRGRLDRPFGV